MPVQAVLTEVYTSLQTGVYEGVVMFPDAVTSFRLNEVAKNFAEVDFGTVASALLTVNKATWDRLSPKIQKILTDVGAEWSTYLGASTAKLQADALVRVDGRELFEIARDELAHGPALDGLDGGETRAAALTGGLGGSGKQRSLAKTMLLNQRIGDVRIAALRGIVPLGLPQETVAFGMKLEDAFERRGRRWHE